MGMTENLKKALRGGAVGVFTAIEGGGVKLAAINNGGLQTSVGTTVKACLERAAGLTPARDGGTSGTNRYGGLNTTGLLRKVLERVPAVAVTMGSNVNLAAGDALSDSGANLKEALESLLANLESSPSLAPAHGDDE